ncbi:MAG TPA: zf-HC2 domain-containing protein [Vicinamibacterales bacterium]|jgi:hypothetical protein
MCDKELLIGYLYGELRLSDRDAFERHLGACAECRSEVEGLSGTRAQLQSWTPPSPELGFEIVRGPQRPPAAAKRWGLSPAWGLAAAAMLVGAVSAAIANVEVTVGSSGVKLRTGWNRVSDARPASTDAAAASAELQRVSARMRDLENRLASIASTTIAAPATAAPPGRMSDAELIRAMRTMIDQSEERQQGVLARQILRVNQDMETARRTDFDRLRQGIQQVQGTAFEVYQRQKAFEEHVVRVGMQR